MEIIRVCNIWKCYCEVYLYEDEQPCPSCKGRGAKFGAAHFKQRHFTVHRCIMCQGEGKVDWIQAIVKKAPSDYTPYTNPSIKEIKMRCTGPDRCKKRLLRLFKQRDDKNIPPRWTQVY